MLAKFSRLQCSHALLQILILIHLGIGIPIKQYDLCLTSVCNQTAESMLENMDKSIKPCDNFYRFACGQFIEKAIIPKDRKIVNIFGKINDNIMYQLKNVTDQPIFKTDIKPFKLAKNLYRACMNVTAIEEQGLSPMEKKIQEMNGWPVILGSKWNESKFDIENTISSFITLHVYPDLKNNSKQMIFFDQASLILTEGSMSDQKIIDEYYNYMIDIAVIFGAEEKRAESEFIDVIQLEMILAKILTPQSKLRDMSSLYNPMIVSNFSKAYPKIPLKSILKKAFTSEIQIDDNDVIIVATPSYFESLNNIFNNETLKRTITNYAIWREVYFMTDYMNEKIYQRSFNFDRILNGQTEQLPRWKVCIEVLRSKLPHSLSALYVRNYFSEKEKKNIEEIMANIRNQFYEILENSQWMDIETKKNAIEKAKFMSSYMAYPEELRNDSIIELFYDGLEISAEYFMESLENITLFSKRESLKRLRSPVKEHDWRDRMFAFVVNAGYTFTKNVIDFPAAILQGMFFDKNRPNYMNYGAIGNAIAHEIIHGFDDQGHQFDKHGNIVNWWNPPTKEHFLRKAQCIINQYKNYKIVDAKANISQNINGNYTQGENIADNGAVKVSYFAYLKWTKINGPEPRLYGLEKYTPRQMFWISHANVWCDKMRPEVMKNQIINDAHSPNEFRIIGALSNMPEFAKDFKCPKGSPMAPSNRCEIW